MTFRLVLTDDNGPLDLTVEDNSIEDVVLGLLIAINPFIATLSIRKYFDEVEKRNLGDLLK